jgi:hypothetical protein
MHPQSLNIPKQVGLNNMLGKKGLSKHSQQPSRAASVLADHNLMNQPLPSKLNYESYRTHAQTSLGNYVPGSDDMIN